MSGQGQAQGFSKNPAEAQSKTLYVGGLTEIINENILREYFSTYGEINRVCFKKYKDGMFDKN